MVYILIWWQVVVWPVNQFIENNDFTGKRLFRSVHQYKHLSEQMAGTVNWLEGQRFRLSAFEENIVVWDCS